MTRRRIHQNALIERGTALLLTLLCGIGMMPAPAAEERLLPGGVTDYAMRPHTTYEKFLPLAAAGDAEIQNFIGYMFFYGEGVVQDFEQAHYWFHEAAGRGNVNAQFNLSLIHGGTLHQVPEHYHDLDEAALWLERTVGNGSGQSGGGPLLIKKGDADIGEKVFTTFCSGCHGMDGIAVYPGAPSFALGERLEMSDQELMQSLIGGKKNMPPWGGTLSRDLLECSLAYIRVAFGDNDYTQGAALRRNKDGAWMGDKISYGAHTFRTFCAGCHGFNGVAYYVNSPSFALGQRMEKSDEELKRSITKGKGVMPSWEKMLSPQQIDSIVAFIRTLRRSYEQGIAGELGEPPPIYFRFRPLGEMGDEWLGADPMGVPPAVK